MLLITRFLTLFMRILITNKMDRARVDRNRNNNINGKMEDEFDSCIDDKVCVYETVISSGFINEELYNTDNKQRSIHNYVAIKDKNVNDQTAVSFIKEKTCDTEYKQGSVHNYVSIKDEDIDEPTTNCTDDKVYVNKTVTSRAYIEQEPCDIKDEESSIQDYFSIKDENLDDLTLDQETKLMTDCIDTKICVYDTIISGGYIKEEPCDTGNESGSIDDIINMKGCIECGEKCDLYCSKCPMLIRIFDSNSPDETDDTVRQTLPKNFLDICETQSGLGIVALRAIPKGVVFGPFKGLDSTTHKLISKWKLKDKKLDVTKDRGRINWMQYIRRADKSSHQNLVTFQYKDGLYYRSECHINVGDELLVRWDCDSRKSEIYDMEDSYWAPEVCENLDDTYVCTFCCVGYKSIRHLKAHNSTCREKRNKNDFCKDIVQCDICKIYLDKKEYSDYHMDRCYKSDKKCVFNSRHSKNRERPLRTGDRPFSCTVCPYKATRKWHLNRHLAIHNDHKPFTCTICPYKARTKSKLQQHIKIHNNDRPFACSYCPYKSNTKRCLTKHTAIHNEDKSFACTFCPHKAKTKSHLKRHMAVHNDDKSFACTLCSYKTKTKWNLQQHIAFHSGDKPFACTFCSYKTTKKSNLKQHMAVHNDDKSFACTFCPYKTKTKSHLKRHVAIHNDDKSVVCTLCPYRTTRKSYLKRHMATHNDDKSSACSLCPYRTTKKSYLKRHMAIHNDDKSFACTLCPYRTTRTSYLKRHMATHTRNGDKA